MAKRKRSKRQYSSAKKRAQTHGSFDRPFLLLPKREGGGDIEFLRFEKKGRFLIDILPFQVGKGNPYADEGELHYERTFYYHPRLGANQRHYLCAAKTLGEPCPVCDYRTELEQDADSDEKVIKSLYPKERQLFNVINTEEREKGVQLWEYSYHNFGKLLDQLIEESDEEDGYENFYHLEGGMTLKLSVSEESMGSNSYLKVTHIDFRPRKKPYKESILEETFCLDDLLKVTPYDKLKAIFLQADEENEEEEEESSSRPKKKGKKKKKKKKKDADFDEDDIPF